MLKCQEGKDPFKKEVKIQHIEKKFIRTFALCKTCKTSINKPYKLEDFPELKRIFNIVQQLQLYDCKNPTVKTPFLDQVKSGEKEPENQPIQTDLFQ